MTAPPDRALDEPVGRGSGSARASAAQSSGPTIGSDDPDGVPTLTIDTTTGQELAGADDPLAEGRLPANRPSAAASLPPLRPGMPARPGGGPDEPIPMLTEVVQVPRYDAEDLPRSLADVDWGELGQRVRENVLERLLRRADTLLEAQLQTTLEPVLARAVEALTLEMHTALNRMVRDIVARAVTEELTRLHAEIARRNRQEGGQAPSA